VRLGVRFRIAHDAAGASLDAEQGMFASGVGLGCVLVLLAIDGRLAHCARLRVGYAPVGAIAMASARAESLSLT
jgi:hypothetical protein